jgi:hypothetical protein
MTPAALDALSPEERHQIYKMLRITVEVSPDGSLNVTGVLGIALFLSTKTSASPGRSSSRAAGVRQTSKS